MYLSNYPEYVGPTIRMLRVWKNGKKVWKWDGMAIEFYFTPSVGAL